MPTYQYRCAECGHELEAVQSFTDDALKVCPECGAEALRKLFGNVGVVFKGSGFYRNDSRSEGKKATTSTTKSADSGKKADTPSSATGAESKKSASGGDTSGTSKSTSGGSTVGGTSASASPAK